MCLELGAWLNEQQPMGGGRAGGVATQIPPPKGNEPMVVGAIRLRAGPEWVGAWLKERGCGLNQHQPMGVGGAEWEERG